jgi:hypothetical protein
VSRRLIAAAALAIIAAVLVVAGLRRGGGPGDAATRGVPVSREGLPGYEGSEFCMACHPGEHAQWEGTLHAMTVHPPTESERELLRGTLLCGDHEPKYVLGERHARRFMLESEEDPQLHVLLPCRYDVAPGTWTNLHESDWRTTLWERSCGACHTTGFSSDDLGYKEMHVGCEACHGPGSWHGDFKKGGRMIAFRSLEPAEEATICASCHLQGGRSRSTGLNFAYNYEPGSDLFADYDFDWELLDQAGDAGNPIDIHQKTAVRDAVRPSSRTGDLELGCSPCHSAHTMDHSVHETLPRDEYCTLCHERGDFKVKEYSQACNVCEF